MDEVRTVAKKTSWKKVLEVLIGGYVTLILYGLGEGAFYLFPNNVWLTSALLFAAALVLLGWYVLFIQIFEHRPVFELNWKKMIPHTGKGLVIGFCYFIALVGMMELLGCYEIDAVKYNGGKLLVFFLLYLLVAVGEVDRAYHHQQTCCLLRGVIPPQLFEWFLRHDADFDVER